MSRFRKGFEEEEEEDDIPKPKFKSLVNKDPVNYIRVMKKPSGNKIKKVRFCVISDTHNQHERLDLEKYGADVLIHAGDFTTWSDWKPFSWSHKVPDSAIKFNDYLGKLIHFKHKIIAIGNHDEGFVKEYCKEYKFPEQKRKKLAKKTISNGNILDNELVNINGINIFVLSYNFKKFNKDLKLEEFKRIIPKETNIIVSHFPPKFAGWGGLYDTLLKLKRLKVACCGHFHKKYSVKRNNGITFISAPSFSKAGMNPVIVFDYYL